MLPVLGLNVFLFLFVCSFVFVKLKPVKLHVSLLISNSFDQTEMYSQKLHKELSVLIIWRWQSLKGLAFVSENGLSKEVVICNRYFVRNFIFETAKLASI